MNNTSGSNIAFDDQGVKITQICFYFAISFIGSVGNVLICIAILKRNQHKISEYFIFNLAITDLAVCIISIPLDIAERLSGFWPYGDVLCKIIYPFQTVLMAVSVATLLAMSLERYRAIIHPFKPRLKVHSSRIIICVIWIGSLLLVSPYIYILSFENDSCIEKWPPGTKFVQIYTMVVFVVLYLCPLLVITVAYSLVSAKLYRDIKRMKGILTVETNSKTRDRILRCRAQRNLRIVKIFIAAVCAFAVCFLPTHVMWLWHDFGSGSEYLNFTNYLVFANILVYMNSCINPFIFGTLRTQCHSCEAFFKRSGHRGRRRMRKFSLYSLRVTFNSSTRLHSHINSLRRASRGSIKNHAHLMNSRSLLYFKDADRVRHGRDWDHLALESNL